MKNCKHVVFLLTLTISSVCYATSTAHEKVMDQVKNFMKKIYVDDQEMSVAIDIYPIDRRIDIPPCSNPYAIELTETASMQTYQTVKVSCESSQWYLFVNAKVEKRRQVVVTDATMSPNTILTQQNLTIADINTQSLRQTTFSRIDVLEGARIKYRVREGQPVTPNMVCFICKGDLITLNATTGGLRISTKGIAQQDGNIGDTIQVKNHRTDKVVLAKVANHETAIVSI